MHIASFAASFFIVSAILASAPCAQVDSSGLALEKLSGHYRDIHTAGVEYIAAPNSPGGEHIIRLAASGDRRFAHEDFVRERAANPRTWTADPYYFVFYDSKSLSVAQALGNIYEISTPSESFRQGFGATQFAMIPWPMVRVWCEEMTADPKTTTSVSDGVLKAKNERLGIILAWAEDGRVLSATKLLGDQQSTYSVEFSDFERGPTVPLPRHATQRTHIVRPNGPTDTQSDFLLTVSLNPLDAEAKLAFEPAKRGLNRLDTGTQDVFGPAGDFLYNLKKREAEIDRVWNDSNSQRPVLYGAITVAVALSCYVALRMYRSRERRGAAVP